VQAIGNPFPIYLDLSGLALALGYIYIGVENEDPETDPQAVFWDLAGAQSATQPIRTISGYIDRDGSPAQIYTQGKYSIRVRNAAGEQVFYAASAGVSENANAGDPYYVHTQWLGDAPGVSQVVMKHVFVDAVSFPADMASVARFHFGTPPGASEDWDLRYDGVSFGTMTIDATGDVTFDCTALDAEASTDDAVHYMSLVTPASATAATNFAGTFKGAVA
jgi:hypothetical protein